MVFSSLVGPVAIVIALLLSLGVASSASCDHYWLFGMLPIASEECTFMEVLSFSFWCNGTDGYATTYNSSFCSEDSEVGSTQLDPSAETFLCGTGDDTCDVIYVSVEEYDDDECESGGQGVSQRVPVVSNASCANVTNVFGGADMVSFEAKEDTVTLYTWNDIGCTDLANESTKQSGCDNKGGNSTYTLISGNSSYSTEGSDEDGALSARPRGTWMSALTALLCACVLAMAVE